MIIKSFKVNAIAASVIAVSTMLPSSALFAQGMVEEIVTTGTRAKARSTTDTLAPVEKSDAK